MAHEQGPLPSHARACVAAGLRLVEAYELPDREAVFAGYLRGLVVGLALARANPGWARTAIDGLEAHADALWGEEAPTRRPNAYREAHTILEDEG